MKLNIIQIIYFCLINYVFTFPNDLFDELWETNQSEPQGNSNPIESQPKIKVEPHEEQFDGGWQDESALKGIVKVEHEPHYGAVKVEGTVKIKHESADDHDQDNSKEAKNLSDQNNSTDQDESVDEQQNGSNKCEKIKSDQRKWEIIQKFREMKEEYRQKGHTKEWIQIERKISNNLGIGRTTIYKWIKELSLRKKKSRFSELEKREILNKFDEIKSKCKKAKLKNSKNELDAKIAKKLGVSAKTIYKWKREFGFSVSNKISDATKIGILKKYAKIKGKNPRMTNAVIADLLKISIRSLNRWKAQFSEEIKNI